MRFFLGHGTIAEYRKKNYTKLKEFCDQENRKRNQTSNKYYQINYLNKCSN